MSESQDFSDQETRLAKFFVEREGEGILEVIRQVDFMEEGIIDSLDFVSLAVYIEKEFQKKLDLTNQDTFIAMRKFDSLMSLICH